MADGGKVKITIKKAGGTTEPVATVDATITQKHPTGAEVVTQEPVEIPVPALHLSALAEVGLSAGVTKNMGDFNSVRFDVHLRVPCAPEDADEAFEKVATWVNEKLESLLEQADGG